MGTNNKYQPRCTFDSEEHESILGEVIATPALSTELEPQLAEEAVESEITLDESADFEINKEPAEVEAPVAIADEAVADEAIDEPSEAVATQEIAPPPEEYRDITSIKLREPEYWTPPDTAKSLPLAGRKKAGRSVAVLLSGLLSFVLLPLWYNVYAVPVWVFAAGSIFVALLTLTMIFVLYRRGQGWGGAAILGMFLAISSILFAAVIIGLDQADLLTRYLPDWLPFVSL